MDFEHKWNLPNFFIALSPKFQKQFFFWIGGPSDKSAPKSLKRLDTTEEDRENDNSRSKTSNSEPGRHNANPPFLLPST